MWGRASSAGRGNERFASRRRLRRRRVFLALSILLVILLGLLVYGLWRSPVRISRVVVYGADQSLADIATSAMQGSYLGLAPRDSTFFFPQDQIREGIISAYPAIAAVSIFRNGFTGLSIKVDYRVPIARWCGATTDATRFNLNASSTRLNLVTPPDCYAFDASGLIFSAAATTTETLNNFTLYAPLDLARGGPPAVSAVEPLQATIAQAEKLPAVFDFARKLNTLDSPASTRGDSSTRGGPVLQVVIRGDEVDDYLASGTRITYVLGNEENAFTALASARANFNLADGSVDYIDLRFDGKVYLKKKE